MAEKKKKGLFCFIKCPASEQNSHNTQRKARYWPKKKKILKKAKIILKIHITNKATGLQHMKTAFRQNMGVPFKLCLSQNRQNHQTGSQQNPYTIQQRRQESKTKLD